MSDGLTISKVLYSENECSPAVLKTVIKMSDVSTITALDVTRIGSGIENITEIAGEYGEYLKQHATTAFSFSDWIELTHNVECGALLTTLVVDKMVDV